MSAQSQKVVYLLDTNVLIGFALWLPIRLNTVFWTKLTEALKNEQWILVDVVIKEIKFNEDLKKWCSERNKEGLVKKLSDSHKERGIEINNQYKMIDQVTQKSTVDTYVIAYAEDRNLTMFSRESPRKNGVGLYKIPDVCDILRVPRIAKPEIFMDAIGYNN
jgi:hypothetical protein